MNYQNPLRSLILLLFLAVPVFCAGEESNVAFVREIEDNLIAPCCWNQPISKHYSEVSEQMRQEVRAMAAAGKSRDDILDYYVAKYGERILAVPRPNGINKLVFILPWAALVLGAMAFLLRRRKQPEPAHAAARPAPDERYAEIVEKELKEWDK